MSTDPAGITFHQPSGHLFITDSEINEISEIWDCKNVFEVSLAGDEVFNTFDICAPGGDPCPAQNEREPTGIVYSAFDGFFYVTDDVNQIILRYDGDLESPPLATVDIIADDSTAIDPEGITCDPNSGNLYVVSGSDGNTAVPQIMVYNSNLEFISNYIVADKIANPEGIAYNPLNNHLFIISGSELRIFEYTLDGAFVDKYDISDFSPKPVRPQGLTFAPSSDPTDDPNNFNLYIADGQVDNNSNINERDGIVYEAKIMKSQP
jgi:sugar lactone lactonase YvrE